MSGSVDNADGKRKWTASPFVGMIEDLKRRAPHYVDDWVQGFHPKVLSSTLFMYAQPGALPAAYHAMVGRAQHCCARTRRALGASVCTFKWLAGSVVLGG